MFLLSGSLWMHLFQYFTISTACYLQVTLVGSLEMPKADVWVVIAIMSGVIGYCAKIYFTYVLNN